MWRNSVITIRLCGEVSKSWLRRVSWSYASYIKVGFVAGGVHSVWLLQTHMRELCSFVHKYRTITITTKEKQKKEEYTDMWWIEWWMTFSRSKTRKSTVDARTYEIRTRSLPSFRLWWMELWWRAKHPWTHFYIGKYWKESVPHVFYRFFHSTCFPSCSVFNRFQRVHLARSFSMWFLFLFFFKFFFPFFFLKISEIFFFCFVFLVVDWWVAGQRWPFLCRDSCGEPYVSHQVLHQAVEKPLVTWKVPDILLRWFFGGEVCFYRFRLRNVTTSKKSYLVKKVHCNLLSFFNISNLNAFEKEPHMGMT